MNYKRILIGGIVAGLIINILNLLVFLLFTKEKYASLQAKGFFAPSPRLPFAPLWILGMFIMGILLAWFYAVSRPRLGAGPKTALLVSFIISLMVHTPYNFAEASFAITGRYLPLVHMVSGIIIFVIAGYVAGWIYQEKSE